MLPAPPVSGSTASPSSPPSSPPVVTVGVGLAVEVGEGVMVEVGVGLFVAVGGAVSTQVVTLSPVSGSVVVVQPDVAVGSAVGLAVRGGPSWTVTSSSCARAIGASTKASIIDSEVSNNNLLTNPPFLKVANYGPENLTEDGQHSPTRTKRYIGEGHTPP